MRPGLWTVDATVLLGGAAAQQADEWFQTPSRYVGAFSQLDETGEHVYGPPPYFCAGSALRLPANS